MNVFNLHTAAGREVPVIISVPHCGTAFPEEVRQEFKPDLLGAPDDTDWFVDRLYDFAPSMGITMVTANISRWVIDLNRDPESKPLYTDGRMITGLCPVTAFSGDFLYADERKEVSGEEVKRRLEAYYKPYHEALESQIRATLERFGKVLLWDCHSIRKTVPSIHPENFPDLILGDNDGLASGEFLTEIVSKSLLTSGYSFENNFLFKGGYITRHYGRPGIHQHALQLEMTKVNYMDDAEREYHPQRAEKMRELLKRVLEKVITVLLL